MSGMPTYPTDSEPTANQMGQPRPAPPAEVLLSVKLWFASIAVSLVASILTYAMTRGAAIDAMVAASPSLSRSEIETAVAVAMVIALILGLIMLGLQILFVLKMRAGRNWARIVLTVLAAISTVSGVIGLASGVTAGSAVNLVALLLLLAATVFMYRPAAKPYFSARRA